MYKIKIFNTSSASPAYYLEEEINNYLEELDTDYQFVDLKYTSAGNDSGYRHSAFLIMNYIPKRKILFEKTK